MLLVPFADMYYNTGQVNKANAIVDRLIDIFGDDLRYYNSLDPAFAKSYYNDDYQRRLSYLDKLSEMAEENHQDKLKQKADSTLSLYTQ